MLVKLEIVKTKVRAASRLGAAKRMSLEVVATRAAALLVRSRPVLQSSRSRDAAKRSTTYAEPCRSGAGARPATPSRSLAALRCSRRHQHSCSSLLTGSRWSLLMARATG